ncbi:MULTISPECIES: hypothetical protein [unclassified Bradyrhizobium]|uniref:hypothetical protein n=1 Tax=unclassified Bradyrhizobium TaxID=2631580 RepID=UPI002916B67B|nr:MULTISPECIES: hypothetical protein [unclassified Bradyrhizobium]
MGSARERGAWIWLARKVGLDGCCAFSLLCRALDHRPHVGTGMSRPIANPADAKRMTPQAEWAPAVPAILQHPRVMGS